MRYKSSELSNLLTAHHGGLAAAVGGCPTAVALDDDGDAAAGTQQYVARVHLESDYLLLRAIRFSSTSWRFWFRRCRRQWRKIALI